MTSRRPGRQDQPTDHSAVPALGGSRYADASVNCHAQQPSRTLVSSRDTGWTSLLVDCRRDGPGEDPFDTGPTPDQAIVVMAAGTQEVHSFAGGAWRRSVYRVGTIGLTPPDQVDRLRFRARKASGEVRKIMIYLPQPLMAEVNEHYRRAGQAAIEPRLDVLAYDDALLAQTAVNLVHAVQVGVDEFYAQTAAQWLAAHLLAYHSPWRGLEEDGRRPGVITHARLAAVIEHMSDHLGEPLTLQELADVAAVSKFHFARLFRSQTGVTPYAYLSRLRLENARRLLATTDEQISQIATRCGFRSASAFTARFAREFGEPPTATRRRR